MNYEEIEIPIQKNTRISKGKNKFKKNGVVIDVKTVLIYEKIKTNFNFTEEEEQEFLQSIDLPNKVKIKGVF